jgi:hypothetical protein
VSAIKNIFKDCGESQTTHLAKTNRNTPHVGWRAIERALITLLQSHRIDVEDVDGEPFVNIVRDYEEEAVVTVELSIERLAKYLAQEVGRHA